MKGRFSLNRILHNNRLMIVISLVLAIILWAGVVYGSGSNEKRNINLGTYTLSFADNSYAKETGLSIIQGAEVDVQVEVSGPRFRINQAQSEISISADLSSIVRPGTYRIPLTATGASDYTIDAVNPSSVTVVADYILSKTLLLTTDISAVTVPEGGEYRLGSAMLDTSVINDDSTLEIEGPQTVLERIESVVARISEGKTIEKATVFPAELVALDANGNAVQSLMHQHGTYHRAKRIEDAVGREAEPAHTDIHTVKDKAHADQCQTCQHRIDDHRLHVELQCFLGFGSDTDYTDTDQLCHLAA